MWPYVARICPKHHPLVSTTVHQTQNWAKLAVTILVIKRHIRDDWIPCPWKPSIRILFKRLE